MTLQSDLIADGLTLISFDGEELILDDMTHGAEYAYRREVWVRSDSCNATIWGGMSFEFCHSINMGGN